MLGNIDSFYRLHEAGGEVMLHLTVKVSVVCPLQSVSSVIAYTRWVTVWLVVRKLQSSFTIRESRPTSRKL